MQMKSENKGGREDILKEKGCYKRTCEEDSCLACMEMNILSGLYVCC